MIFYQYFVARYPLYYPLLNFIEEKNKLVNVS